MSTKSMVYSANTNSQSVTSGGTVNFGSPIRRFGCSCYTEGGNGAIRGQGYYTIDINLTFNSATAGEVTVSILKDGVAIPGANAMAVLTANEDSQITIPCAVRELCNCESIITVTITGEDTTVTNAALLIEKV